MQCEMCGRQGMLFKTRVEGSVMHLCKPCTKYGVVLGLQEKEEPKKEPEKESRIIKKQDALKRFLKPEDEFLAEDLGEQVKKMREKMGLKQSELAQKIAEKESVIHHIESGSLVPGLELARKLEKFFKTRFILNNEEDV